MMCPYELGLRKILDMPLSDEENQFVRAWNQKYERVRALAIQKLGLSDRFSFTPGDDFIRVSDDDCVEAISRSVGQALQAFNSGEPSNPPLLKVCDANRV